MGNNKITTDKIVVDNETKRNYDGEYFGNKNPKRVIMFLCNQKKCGDSCSASEDCCYHTTNIKYAKNYTNIPPNKTLEKHFNKEYMVLDEPTIIFTEKKGEYNGRENSSVS